MIRNTDTGHEAKPSDRLDNSSEKAARMQLEGLDPKAWPLFGYAPGNYLGQCVICEQMFQGDKRAVHCLECAARAANKAIASPSMGVRVRDLEWLPYGRRWRAESPIGKIIVNIAAGQRFYFSINGEPSTQRWGSSDEAKAAAKADYTARIMAALVSHPTPSGDSQASLPVVTAGPFSELSGGPLADREKSADHLDRPIGYVTPAAMELMRDGNSASGYHLVFRAPHAASQPKQQSADVPLYLHLPHQSREEIIEECARVADSLTDARVPGNPSFGAGMVNAASQIASAIRDLQGGVNMGKTVEHELDTCLCGDYRRDHVDGHGACRHNKPKDLTHGYKDCLRFRLARAYQPDEGRKALEARNS